MSRNTYLEQVARGLKKTSTTSSRVVSAIIAEMFMFILDRSWSMEAQCGRATRLDAAKQAIMAMLDSREQLGADDHLAIIAFDNDAHLIFPFSRCAGNRGRIERAIHSIDFGGGTAFGPPLRLAKRILPSSGDVHIVVLSDGHAGAATWAADALKKKGAIIETVGVGDQRSDVNERVLKATASILRGKVLYRFLTDADDMIEYFRTDVANRLVKRG